MRTFTLRFGFIIGLCIPLICQAEEEITIELDKTEFLLGENIILHWRILNVGTSELKFDVGGDSRTPGAKRAIRFKVEAIDAEGRNARDPFPNPRNFGGWGGGGTLQPGKDYWDEVQLMRYRELEPGKYTIRVYHDLGWDGSDRHWPHPNRASDDIPTELRRAPVVTTSLHVAMPNEQQARELVAKALAEPKNPGRTWGQRGKAFADFELFRYPVYLPMMRGLADAGDQRGLEAIGEMPFPEATAALVELSRHSNSAIAEKAQGLLWLRSPLTVQKHPSNRMYLREHSWTPELQAQVAERGWELLEADDRESLMSGSRLISSFGRPDDLPRLMAVMDRVLPMLRNDPIEQNSYLRPPTACGGLIVAAGTLIEAGASLPEDIQTPGRSVGFLLGLKHTEKYRPDHWEENLVRLFSHDIAVVREQALQCAPLPFSEVMITAALPALADPSEAVQGAACDFAERSKSPRFQSGLTDMLATSQNEWLIKGAFRSAIVCGAHRDEVLETVLKRLGTGTPERNFLYYTLLMDAFDCGGYGYNSNGNSDWPKFVGPLKKSWKRFIASNRQELRDGKKFPLGEGPVTAELAVPGLKIDRKGKPPWPDVLDAVRKEVK